MNTDNIEYYTEDELKTWLHEFSRPENAERVTLPNIPFSYYEIARALRQIDNIKGALEENDYS